MHGDIHDIGKDVVVMMLEVSGYDVHDLGIDVPVESFVAAIKEHGAQVVGLSGLLTLAFDSMKDTIEGIAAAGLRDQVKIMIGGSPVDEQVCTYSGADGWGRDATAALSMAAEWTGGCGMTPTPQELYAQREQRFNDIVALRKPDRIPFMPLMMHYFPTRSRASATRAAGYDTLPHDEAMKEATLEFGWDLAPADGVFGREGYEALQIKQIRWPGGDLPDDAAFQFVEDEYVKADEVGAFLADPNGFATAHHPAAHRRRARGRWAAASSAHALVGEHVLPASVWRPLFSHAAACKAMLEAMLALAEDAANCQRAPRRHVLGEMAGDGLPAAVVGVAIIPAFDMVSDTSAACAAARWTCSASPSKLLAMIDVMRAGRWRSPSGRLQDDRQTRAFIPMHRGAGGFMSDEQFEKFYWPTFSALI